MFLCLEERLEVRPKLQEKDVQVQRDAHPTPVFHVTFSYAGRRAVRVSPCRQKTSSAENEEVLPIFFVLISLES